MTRGDAGMAKVAAGMTGAGAGSCGDDECGGLIGFLHAGYALSRNDRSKITRAS